MPEGLEAEIYRRGAERAIGRRIESVLIDERQEMAMEIPGALIRGSIVAARRIGKLLLLDLEQAGALTLGIHFGMTGRLVVDGRAPIGALEYSSGRDDPGWDRFAVTFEDGGVMRVNDPRRWARFVLDPVVERLGPDFFTVTADHLLSAFDRRRAPLKSVLLDQGVVAGFGNMCVDEILWQAALSPMTPARDVPRAAVERFVQVARAHLPAMLDRGGSNCGTIDPPIRAALPPCPRDGAPLHRDRVAGRTTIWCPTHQVER
ncbi:MAG: DNA-formamidopyrimidine glycosylase family protein [Ilumatobacteraceae bacterium]